MTPRPPLWKRVLLRLVLTALRGVEFGTGVVLVSPLYQKLRALWLGIAASPVPPVRTALVAHVYYLEFWPEIVKVWQALPAGSPLLVTTPHGQGSQIRTLGGENPLIEIYESENRGRDIAPFLMLLNAGRLDRFDAVLKIHTKKSPHLRLGNLRRRILYTAVAGHPGIVRRILRQFSDPRVGLVGAASFFRTRDVFWMNDKALVETLCRRMEPNGPVRLGFFEGSIFWVRPQALAPLRMLDLQPDDFDAEAGQLDGTLHHAVERIFTLSALAAGYETRSIAGKTLLAA
jgi:rhamnosyltransferase